MQGIVWLLALYEYVMFIYLNTKHSIFKIVGGEGGLMPRECLPCPSCYAVTGFCHHFFYSHNYTLVMDLLEGFHNLAKLEKWISLLNTCNYPLLHAQPGHIARKGHHAQSLPRLSIQLSLSDIHLHM